MPELQEVRRFRFNDSASDDAESNEIAEWIRRAGSRIHRPNDLRSLCLSKGRICDPVNDAGQTVCKCLLLGFEALQVAARPSQEMIEMKRQRQRRKSGKADE